MPAGTRRFLTEAVIPTGSPLVNKRVSDSGLARHRLLKIYRGEHELRGNTAAAVLKAGDRLIIESERDELLSLRSTRNVALAGVEPGALQTLGQKQAKIVEAIVGPEAPILGRTVKELRFDLRFGVHVVGIYRHKKRLNRSISELQLKVGDILLLEGAPNDLMSLYDNRNFINIAVPESRPLNRDKAWIALLAIFLVVVLAAFEVMPIVTLAVIGATVVVITGCLTAEEAYQAIHWPILLLIFAMLAIGLALEQTGAMSLMVNGLAKWAITLGPMGLLITLYVVTSFSTEFMSNNAAAILLTPIAIGAAMAAGLDPKPFVVAVMLAGSASFATPIGYQTNTFVYQAGGYRFTDFLRIGLPMNILALMVTVWLIPKFWPLVPA
jgi:di/tricarboxylate transporter